MFTLPPHLLMILIVTLAVFSNLQSKVGSAEVLTTHSTATSTATRAKTPTLTDIANASLVRSTDTLDAALPSRAHSQKLAQSSSIITRHHSCKSCTPGNHDTLPTSLFLILHAYLRYSSTMEDQLRAGMQQVRGGAAG